VDRLHDWAMRTHDRVGQIDPNTVPAEVQQIIVDMMNIQQAMWNRIANEAKPTSERRVEVTWASSGLSGPVREPVETSISSIEDLEALCERYGASLIISRGPDGKLNEVMIYDDYIE
jgi:hypothetical protein